MIKVLFVYSDRYCSCTRKRTFEVVKALINNKKEEILTHVVYYLNLKEKYLEEHDIIIFQRLGANGGNISERYEKELFRLLDKYIDKTKFIYDIDDFIFERQGSFPKKMMNKCHYVLAPNKFMQEKQIEYNKNSYLIRTHIDLETFQQSPEASGFHKNVVNIGWFSGNGLGLEIMDKIFPKLKERYLDKIHIHFFALNDITNYVLKKYKNEIFIAHRLLKIEEMFGALKSLDFIVNPMDYNNIAFQVINKNTKKEKEDFINCKSEIKYLNAGAAGIPLITSPNNAYKFVINNGENGFIAENLNDWIKYIDILIKDSKKRNEIGMKAKEDIYLNYSLENVADNYHKFFKKVLENK